MKLFSKPETVPDFYRFPYGSFMTGSGMRMPSGPFSVKREDQFTEKCLEIARKLAEDEDITMFMLHKHLVWSSISSTKIRNAMTAIEHLAPDSKQKIMKYLEIYL